LKGDMGMIGFGSIGNKVSVEDATECAFCCVLPLTEFEFTRLSGSGRLAWSG